MPAKGSAQVNESEPRPIQKAFKPAGKADLRADLMIAGVLLAGFLLGLLANLLGDFSGFMDASERGLNNTLTPFLLQVLVYFGYPVFLIGALYFSWHAWNYWQKTKNFIKSCVRTEGMVTHLWKVPPSGSGKLYFLGYQYSGDKSAFLQVDVYMFKRLQIGMPIPVNYLPEDHATSFPELPGQATLSHSDSSFLNL